MPRIRGLPKPMICGLLAPMVTAQAVPSPRGALRKPVGAMGAAPLCCSEGRTRFDIP
jgi:hypothetical protein